LEEGSEHSVNLLLPLCMNAELIPDDSFCRCFSTQVAAEDTKATLNVTSGETTVLATVNPVAW